MRTHFLVGMSSIFACSLCKTENRRRYSGGEGRRDGFGSIQHRVVGSQPSHWTQRCTFCCISAVLRDRKGRCTLERFVQGCIFTLIRAEKYLYIPTVRCFFKPWSRPEPDVAFELISSFPCQEPALIYPAILAQWAVTRLSIIIAGEVC